MQIDTGPCLFLCQLYKSFLLLEAALDQEKSKMINKLTKEIMVLIQSIFFDSIQKLMSIDIRNSV